MMSTAAATTAVRHWIRGHKAVVELASPKNRNALSLGALQELHDTIKTLVSRDHNDGVRVIVLQASAQAPAFCSGHDLRELQRLQKNGSTSSAAQEQQVGTAAADEQQEQIEALFRSCSDTMQTIANSPIPIIAKVDGVATAAGCQLVASCDLAYASLENSSFATPGVNIGLFCSTPAVALSRAVSHKKQVMEMLLTGLPVSAQKAQAIGLINEAVPQEELDSRVDEIADLIASKSPMAVQMGKPAFQQQLELPLKEAYGLASTTMCANATTDECKEGVDAFLEKRKPIW
jgi:enoyl-CoA hydratase/carnithine racemase